MWFHHQHHPRLRTTKASRKIPESYCSGSGCIAYSANQKIFLNLVFSFNSSSIKFYTLEFLKLHFIFQLDANVLPVKSMTNCCDDHDLCYSECFADKDQCDIIFRKCLYNSCDKHRKTFTEERFKSMFPSLLIHVCIAVCLYLCVCPYVQDAKVAPNFYILEP